MPTKTEIAKALQRAGDTFGVEPALLADMAKRESGMAPHATNVTDANAREGAPSRGMFQYIEPIFGLLNEKARAERPEVFARFGEPDWLNWEQQAFTAAWAITRDNGPMWPTYKAALEELEGHLQTDPADRTFTGVAATKP